MTTLAAAVAGAGLVVGPHTARPAEAAGNGSLLAWGLDAWGAVGDGGANDDRFRPVTVTGLGAGTNAVDIGAGYQHSVSLGVDGSVLAWGLDAYGQVGDGDGDAPRSTPVAVTDLGADSGVVDIAAGDFHNLAVRADGSVLAWGQDLSGQLGDGGELVVDWWLPYQRAMSPVAVKGLGPGSGVVRVDGGASHSLALRADGRVLAWGSNSSGQLGTGVAGAAATAPVAVSGLGIGGAVVAVAAGGAHSLALRTDGSVLAWGANNREQLGQGGFGNGPSQPAPVQVTGLGPGSGVVAVAAGGSHSLALRADGTVLAWGMSYVLGSDARSDATVPVEVTGLGPGSGVVAIDAGTEHSLAVRADGSVVAWGVGQYGRLGDGGADSSGVPVAVQGLGPGSGVVQVAAGLGHSLAATVAPPGGATFRPVSPKRVWDTRAGPGPMGRLGGGVTRSVTVAGAGGVPASGVAAVVLNLTAISPSARTYLTVWPAGEPRPVASNLNVPAGDTRANLVTVKLGAGGQVNVFNDAGTVDLAADVAGWYGATGGQRYTAVSPARVWDTRAGPGSVGRMGAGGVRNLAVTGVGGIPAVGVSLSC